jgi:hypothetical protein
LLIFDPPKIVDFPNKPVSECCVGGEVHLFNLSHEMPVVIIVAVVVSQNPAVVYRATPEVDIRQAVINYLPILEPHLLFQERPFSLAFEAMLLYLRRSNRLLLLAHKPIIPQKGFIKSPLQADRLVFAIFRSC